MLSNRPKAVLLAHALKRTADSMNRLLSDFGCDVHRAPDGAEALRVASRLVSLDLLITDLLMPRMDGFDLIQRVASIHPDAKAILLSGRPLKSNAFQIVDGLRVFFIPKPLPPEAVVDRARALLFGKGGDGTSGVRELTIGSGY